jgi:hypothetical protein
MGVGGQRHALAAFTPGKEPVPIVQEAGWPSEPVWTGAENLALTSILSPDLPARSIVTIPTELFRPTIYINILYYLFILIYINISIEK